MPAETRKHTHVTLVDGVAVVGFNTPDSFFETKQVQELDDELHRLVAVDGHTKLLLNLTGIRYFSSSMLVRLIQLKKSVEPAQGRICLCNLAPVMLDMFRISKLDHLFEIFDDEASALARFHAAGPDQDAGRE